MMNHTIVDIPIPIPPPLPPLPCLPRLDLLEGRREEYNNVAVPLYEAAIKGDWKAAKPIIDEHPDVIRFAITENHDTLLHIAASAGRTKSVENFVENLVDLMLEKDLQLQNKNYNTALGLAAAAGNLETARIMVRKNSNLSEIPGKRGMMPLYMAALFEKPSMVRYLYGISNKMCGVYWTHVNRGWVLHRCVEADIFDVAMKIFNDRPELNVKKGLLTDVLVALAQKTEAFEETKSNFFFRIIKLALNGKVEPPEKECEALQLLKIIWGKIVKMPKNDIDDILRGPAAMVEKKNKEKEYEALSYLKVILKKIDTGKTNEIEKEKKIITYPSRVLFVATKAGNTRFIIELIRSNPDLIWKIDDKGKTIFHLAVKRRQMNIFKLIYEIGSMKDLITPLSDKKGNNMLHMVAKKAKQKINQNVSEAALGMQQELLWYKEVEKMIPPSYRKRKNKAGETPQDLMAKKHAYLVSKGEDWMNYYMLVGTLIATIVFAAAFTLPGGYNQNSGLPFFSNEPSLIIFVISDALSLISASTSVLVFLSILTSRYTENDFMESLPGRLTYGIATLTLSVASMMLAFCSSFFVLYNKKLQWVPIMVTSLGTLPVIMYAITQYHIVKKISNFVYQGRYLFAPNERFLYY